MLYIDNSVGIYNTHKNELVTYLCGNFKKITSAKWVPNKLTNYFLTCSYDMTLCLWSHAGDRWSFTCCDIPTLIDPALRHYRFPSLPMTGDSNRNLQLTTLAIHPKHLYVICGSAQGSIWFLDLEKNKQIGRAHV